LGLCEFNIAIGADAGSEAPQDGLTWPAPPAVGSNEVTIYFHTGEGANGRGRAPQLDPLQEECYGVAGSDADDDGDAQPGGFGWLQEAGGCTATIDPQGWVQAEPGNGVPNECNPNPDWIDAEVTLPLFDDIDFNEDRPCGSNKCYHIFGWVRFHITGFRFPSEAWGGACSPPLSCLRGYFMEYTTLADGPRDGSSGGPSLGVTEVWLSG
jgi:hypothetical protein